MIEKQKVILNRLIKGNHSGATAVEFALVAPVFFLVFMGVIELGLIFFVYTVLEGATAHGSRVGLTGFSVGNREAYIKSEIENLSGGFLDPNKLVITILSYSSFVNVGQPEPCINPPTPPCPGNPGLDFVDVNGNGQWDQDQGKVDNAGTGNDVVLYKVEYPWSVFTPLMANIIGNPYMVSAIATAKNEAFGP